MASVPSTYSEHHSQEVSGILRSIIYSLARVKDSNKSLKDSVEPKDSQDNLQSLNKLCLSATSNPVVLSRNSFPTEDIKEKFWDMTEINCRAYY